MCQKPRLPRKAVLTPNLHHGRQDLSNLEARTSADRQCKESEEYGETRSEEIEEIRSGNIDFRIQGLPHSTVQKEDDVRRETVKRMIHQFETHPNRESLMADLNKNHKFNLFSEESREWIRSLGNTKYSELCEITSKIQCPDCSLFLVENRHCMLYVRQMLAHEPNFIDNYHISETTETFQALSSPLFQEREDDASRIRAYHSLDESLLSSQSLSLGHVRTGRLVNEFGSLISNVRKIHVATQ